MSIVNNLNLIRDWLQTEVCDKVEFKIPNDNDIESADFTKPTAFVLFVPTKDRLPPNVVAPIPSVCVRLAEGEHTADGRDKMKLVLNFCTWNPGITARDTLQPVVGDWQAWNATADAEYKRSSDGWHDVYTFIDVALRAIENAEYIQVKRDDMPELGIGGLRVVKEDGIKYGMAEGQDGIEDFYPYWPAWISFSVQSGNIRASQLNEFL